ncbi:MAG: carbohydrate ABC transporter substrate-binding protein [Roseburia sp.]|nr:carbohydrate ABC transporter substrate-binding protein [Roseburia sp.]
MAKKIVSLLLCVAMTATLLTGCGDNSTANTDADKDVSTNTEVESEADSEGEDAVDPLRADEGTTISIAHNQGEYIYETFYAMGEKFTEMTGIEIEWIEVPNADWGTWTTAQFAAGTEPDIVWSVAKDYYDQGKLMNLTEYYDQENPFNGKIWRDCFSTENALTNCYSNDGQDLICTAMTYSSVNLYYNKDIMEELGLGTEPPTNYSELIAMMDVAKEDGTYVPMSAMNSTRWNLSWIEDDYMDALFDGTDVVEKLDIIVPNGYMDYSEIMLGLKTGVISYDDPRFEEYFRLIKELTQYFNEDFNSASWEYEGLFNDSKALFTFNGGWFPGQVVQNGYEVNYGTTKKPYVDEAYSEYGVSEGFLGAAPSGEAVFFVSKKAEDEGRGDAAVKFLQFMTCPEGGAQMYIDVVMLGTCIADVVLPDEIAGLATSEYGDHKTTRLIRSFMYDENGEVTSKYWEMFTEYVDPASTKTAAEFIEDLKAELLPALDDTIEEYTTYDILSYVDQVQ